MKANEILRLLEERHFEDVFVPECKNGPTQTTSHLRLDGWAMAKSWAIPRMIGYEIKVSRGDFNGDSKWMGYLPLCNELYFVCPPKLIQPQEVPECAGLIWAGARLLTKKKAPYRIIDPPVDLLKYILMCRVSITRYERDPKPDEDKKAERTARMRRWIESRKEGEDVGYMIARQIGEEMRRFRSENTQLKAENARLANVGEKLEELGYPAWASPGQVEMAYTRLKQEVPPEFVRLFREMAHRMDNFASKLEKIHGNNE
jgi:hypothetical protein